jgi:hypothetical protein
MSATYTGTRAVSIAQMLKALNVYADALDVLAKSALLHQKARHEAERAQIAFDVSRRSLSEHAAAWS